MKQSFARIVAGFSLGFVVGGLATTVLIGPLGGPVDLLLVDAVVGAAYLWLGDRHRSAVSRRARAATATRAAPASRPLHPPTTPRTRAVRDDLRLPAAGRRRHPAARLRGVGARRLPLPRSQRPGAVPGAVRHGDQHRRAGLRLPRGRETAGPVRRARRPQRQPARVGRPAGGGHGRRGRPGERAAPPSSSSCVPSRSPTSPSSTA